MEMNHIWRRKFNWATLLFILSRYCFFLSALINVLEYFAPQTAPLSCFTMVYLWDVFEITYLSVVGVTSAFRVWAIWGKAWVPFFAVLSVGLVTPVMNIYSKSQDRFVNISPLRLPFGGCMWTSTIPEYLYPRLATISRSSLIVCDALVLLATWMKAFGIKRAAKRAGTQARLSNLLLRDGTLYFGTLLTINCLAIIFSYMYPVLNNPVSQFTDVMTCILISRFILNLRSFDVAEYDDTNVFDSRIESALGNIGASLSPGSSHGDSSRTLCATSKQVSENPLSVGLLDD